MHEGMRLAQSGNDADALPYFDRALDLRLRLPTEVPVLAYGLAACWLNRAESLTRLGPAQHAAALSAYYEGLALLRPLPLADDPRFSRRLAIALQNRALLISAQNPRPTVEVIASLVEAKTVLEQATAMDPPERNYLLAVVWMNLANVQASEITAASDQSAREAARQALALIKELEREAAGAAEVGLKARHVLCHIAARQLSAQKKTETPIEGIEEATDLADEGLALVRQWEQRGVNSFRPLAADLLRFGGRVYAHYQPHFLHEFLSEQLDPLESVSAYVQSPEIQEAAREIVSLLPTSSSHHE